MSNLLEHVYPYQLKRRLVTGATIFIGLLAMIIAYFASRNDRGLRLINRGTTLSTELATIFLWGLAALLAAITGFCIFLLVISYRVEQRIAFTNAEVLLPKSLWSPEEKQIAYRDIQDIMIRTENSQRWAVIKHAGGKNTIAEAMLANSQIFDEVVNRLVHKVRG